MSGYQLLQSAHLHPQHGAGLFHGDDRRDQFGVHLIATLRREQTALRDSRTALGFQDLQQFGASFTANLAQSRLAQWVVRFVSRVGW